MRARMTLAAIAVWLLGGVIATQAAYTVPAVNLPAQTPDAIRDRVARSLASTRDQVGRVLHPFRGEFHGLGIGAGLGTGATDLSSDGRVVVGYDRTSLRSSRAFVWSPATGMTQYSMAPSGEKISVAPTAVSADGVYIGGNVWTNHSSEPYYYGSSSSGFLWSLAGSSSFPTNQGRSVAVSALSADGRVAVGSQFQDRYFGNVYYVGSYGSVYFDGSPSSSAYRYTRGGAVQEPGVLSSGAGYYLDSNAADVTQDGNIVLLNGAYHTVESRSEPFLWVANGALRSLGRFDPIPGAPPQFQLLHTIANAISGDGSTVVGYAQNKFSDYGYGYGLELDISAVLWREKTGWIDLGRFDTAEDETFTRAQAEYVSGDGSIVIGDASVKRHYTLPGGVNVSAGYQVPFIWEEARGMRKVADVLQLDYGLDLTGWTLNNATGISEDGTTIIGNGLNPDGRYEAWRAVLARTTPLGDIDFDGDIDPQDYAQLTSNFGATSADRAVYYADGDLNADGRVDQSDAATLLGLYQGRRQGDFNADGVVNLADYTVWRDNLGQYTGGLADSNGDGWVNGADLAAWRTHFGRALGSQFPFSIPEPTAATLFAAAFLGVSRRR